MSVLVIAAQHTLRDLLNCLSYFIFFTILFELYKFFHAILFLVFKEPFSWSDDSLFFFHYLIWLGMGCLNLNSSDRIVEINIVSLHGIFVWCEASRRVISHVDITDRFFVWYRVFNFLTVKFWHSVLTFVWLVTIKVTGVVDLEFSRRFFLVTDKSFWIINYCTIVPSWFHWIHCFYCNNERFTLVLLIDVLWRPRYHLMLSLLCLSLGALNRSCITWFIHRICVHHLAKLYVFGVIPSLSYILSLLRCWNYVSGSS